MKRALESVSIRKRSLTKVSRILNSLPLMYLMAGCPPLAFLICSFFSSRSKSSMSSPVSSAARMPVYRMMAQAAWSRCACHPRVSFMVFSSALTSSPLR